MTYLPTIIKVLISHVKTLTESLPRPFGLFGSSGWQNRTSNDHRYTEWLENTFHSADFVRNLSYLMLAFKVALESKVR